MSYKYVSRFKQNWPLLVLVSSKIIHLNFAPCLLQPILQRCKTIIILSIYYKTHSSKAKNWFDQGSHIDQRYGQCGPSFIRLGVIFLHCSQRSKTNLTLSIYLKAHSSKSQKFLSSRFDQESRIDQKRYGQCGPSLIRFGVISLQANFVRVKTMFNPPVSNLNHL